MKATWLWLLPACVTGLIVRGLFVLPVHSQVNNPNGSNSLDQARAILATVDLTPTLPAPAELPNFYRYRATGGRILSPRPGQLPTSLATLDATRLDDGLTLMIQLGITATPAEAQELAHEAINTPGGLMPEGTPSGRAIAQKVWHSRYYDGGPPKGSYHLIAYDGRALVIVRISAPLTGYKNGKPVEAPLSQADLQMTEDIASACLSRIGDLGFTSKPGLTASAKRRFIAQRMALMHPAKRTPRHTAHR